jgi:hypothetical protein
MQYWQPTGSVERRPARVTSAVGVVYTVLVLLAISQLERVIPVGPATASRAPTWTEDVAASQARGRDYRLVSPAHHDVVDH